MISGTQDYDGMIVRSGTRVTKDIIEAGNKLKAIGRAGTGVDNIDVTAASEKGIAVIKLADNYNIILT